MFILSEWFCSKQSAVMAGERARTSGYQYAVENYGLCGWLLTITGSELK